MTGLNLLRHSNSKMPDVFPKAVKIRFLLWGNLFLFQREFSIYFLHVSLLMTVLWQLK